MKQIAALAADAFQDSEYFLPKIAIENLGLQTEVISLGRDPIEIYSYFSRVATLEVNKTIQEAAGEKFGPANRGYTLDHKT